MTVAPTTAPARSVAPQRRQSSRWLLGWALLGPAVLVMFVFRVLPVAYGAYLSLTDWSGFAEPEIIGLNNYTRMFGDDRLKEAVLNNLTVLLVLPVFVFMPLVLAVLIHEGAWLGKFLKVAYMIPTLIAPALLGLMFTLVLGPEGPVNQVLGATGLESVRNNWLADPDTVLLAFIAILVWGGFGTGVLLFSAGLASVDQALYDAAALDGAGWWHRLRHITVPLLGRVTLFWSVIVFIALTTATFPLLQTLTGGGPGHETTTIDLYIYQLAFQARQSGYATAIAMTSFVVILLVIMLSVYVQRRRQGKT